MADINITLDPALAGKTKEEMLKLFDQEVERFSNFMANLKDWRARGPLMSGEKAIIKTYLVQKYTGKF